MNYFKYYKRYKKEQKIKIFQYIKAVFIDVWQDLWFEWHWSKHLTLGGKSEGYRTFRTQRLFNLLIILLVVGTILYLCFA